MPLSARLLTAGLVLLAAPAAAQSVQDVRRDIARVAQDGAFGKSVLGIAGFAAMPGVSAAEFRLDNGGLPDTEVSRLALPLSNDWETLRILGAALHTELTLGWFTAEQDYGTFFRGTAFQGRPSSEINSWTGVAGLGLAFPVGERTTLTPLMMLGYGRVEDDTDFTGPGAARLGRATRGVLFNWRTDELIYGPAVKLDHATQLGADIGFEGTARANLILAETLDASHPALEGSSEAVVLTAHGELDGPTGATIAGRELRWLAFAAGTAFGADAADSLGIDGFVELGAGLEIVDRSILPQIALEGASLRASVILGDGVTGWSLGGQLEF